MSIQTSVMSAVDDRPYARNQTDKYVSLRDLFRILRRRRMTILLTVATLTALSGVISWLLVPKYTATAEIMINPRASRVVNMQAVLDDLPNDVTTIETQVKLIKFYGIMPSDWPSSCPCRQTSRPGMFRRRRSSGSIGARSRPGPRARMDAREVARPFGRCWPYGSIEFDATCERTRGHCG